MPTITDPTPSALARDVWTLTEAVATRLREPRVRALHLPPPPADGSRRGEFAALELDDGSLGLSYVLLHDTLAQLRGQPGWAQAVAGRPAREVAQELADAPGPRRTLGWAAAHALAHSLQRRAGWQPPPAADSLAGLAPQPGDHVGLVGLFGPLMPRLVATGARITVLELRADWAGAQDGYTVTLDPQALASCRWILATGTLLLNDTLDTLTPWWSQAQRVALIGPTVSGLPDPLFARGVHAVGGTWVQDPAAYLAALHDGQERRDAARKFLLERADWPGWQALVQRVG